MELARGRQTESHCIAPTQNYVTGAAEPQGVNLKKRSFATLLRDFVKAILAITYPLSTLCAMNANVEYDQDDSYLCGC